MDFATLGGLILAWGSLFALLLIEGGHLGMLVNLGAFILVVGGTIGVTVIGMSVEDIKGMPAITLKAFFSKAMPEKPIIQTLIGLSRTVRREGLLSLESVINETKDEFFKKALQIVVDGMDADQVRSILETDLELLEERHKRGQKVFTTLGGFGPTLGIIGTVMGLVHMLANISSPDTMGPAIAAAFIATLYGVSTANLIYIPIGNKLARVHEAESHTKQIIMEGVLSIQAGDNPRILEEKLLSFLPPKMRAEMAAALKEKKK